VDAELPRPLVDRQGLPVIDKEVTIVAIVRLFFPSGPTNVPRRVVLVILDAVQRVLWRGPTSNIREKCFERVQPTITDRDPAAAIACVPLVAWVVTSVLHRPPRTILWRHPTVRLTVLGASSICGPDATAARLRAILLQQVVLEDETFIAAVAATKPAAVRRPACARPTWRDDKKHPKPPAGEIVHGPFYIPVEAIRVVRPPRAARPR
jgi:hypothetical protein